MAGRGMPARKSGLFNVIAKTAPLHQWCDDRCLSSIWLRKVTPFRVSASIVTEACDGRLGNSMRTAHIAGTDAADAGWRRHIVSF